MHPEKSSLYFEKWNFKKRKPRKKILIFQETGTIKKPPIFCEMELFSPPRENLLILQETEAPKKFLIFSQKKASLIFWELETPKKFFIFRETETLKNFLYFRKWNFQAPSLKNLLFFRKEFPKSENKKYFIPFLIKKKNF